tara:strand:- start:618 stop:995 length:378 start_codon:yes stop_codon:yes gene_type:complete
MKITKSKLRRIILEEFQKIEEEGKVAHSVAIIDYDEGGITISDGWRPPTRLDFLSFNDLPESPDGIENAIAEFFKKNGVREVRDDQRDTENMDPMEWLSITLQAMIADGENPFDYDPWTADGWKA